MITCLVFILWTPRESWGVIRMQLSPPIFEAETQPKTTLTYSINVLNTGEDQLTLATHIKSVKFDRLGNIIFQDATYQEHSCQTWIDVDPKSIVLPQGEKRPVDVVINVPANVTGGYYAAILFETQQPHSTAGQSTVGLQLRTGSLVCLRIKKTCKLDAMISSFSLNNKQNQTEFQIILKNNSNCHITPKGSLVIYTERNRIIDRININDSTFMLPNSERHFTVIWSNERKRVPGTSYLAECRFDVKGLGKSLSYKSQPFNI